MSNDPDTSWHDEPASTPALAKIFDPYYAHARDVYNERVAKDTSLPAPTELSKFTDILAWKDIVEEVFLIKAKRHLPFPEPQDLDACRKAVIERIRSHGFAIDDHEPGKPKASVTLYKNLARHANGALEAFRDSDLEANHKRPYTLEIAHDGSQRLRGARGRWQSAKPAAELELREGLGEMKMAWAERVKDPLGETLIQRLYAHEMSVWNDKATTMQELDEAAEDSGYSPMN